MLTKYSVLHSVRFGAQLSKRCQSNILLDECRTASNSRGSAILRDIERLTPYSGECWAHYAFSGARLRGFHVHEALDIPYVFDHSVISMRLPKVLSSINSISRSQAVNPPCSAAFLLELDDGVSTRVALRRRSLDFPCEVLTSPRMGSPQ